MELREVQRNTKVKIFGEWYNFHHLDGMYSYCKTENGGVVNWRFDTPVDEVGESFTTQG